MIGEGEGRDGIGKRRDWEGEEKGREVGWKERRRDRRGGTGRGGRTERMGGNGERICGEEWGK